MSITEVLGVCKRCGFIELAPVNEMEQYNGGLMVDRKDLVIKNESGVVLEKLRKTKTRKFNQYYGCNYCVNKW